MEALSPSSMNSLFRYRGRCLFLAHRSSGLRRLSFYFQHHLLLQQRHVLNLSSPLPFPPLLWRQILVFVPLVFLQAGADAPFDRYKVEKNPPRTYVPLVLGLFHFCPRDVCADLRSFRPLHSDSFFSSWKKPQSSDLRRFFQALNETELGRFSTLIQVTCGEDDPPSGIIVTAFFSRPLAWETFDFPPSPRGRDRGRWTVERFLIYLSVSVSLHD